jgi:hypothetical protein
MFETGSGGEMYVEMVCQLAGEMRGRGIAARGVTAPESGGPGLTAQTGRSLCERRDTPLLRGARRGSDSSVVRPDGAGGA